MAFEKEAKSSSTRRKARECALQMLFAADVVVEPKYFSTEDYWKELGEPTVNEKTREFADNLVNGTIRELSGFAGYFLMEADNGVLSSISLFETSEQADESNKLVKNWISEENFSKVIPNAPKITSGKVVAQSKIVPALV